MLSNMRLTALFICLTVLAAFPALAEEAAEKPVKSVVQKEIPFREDSGLTKAESLLSDGAYSAAIDTAGDVLKRRPRNADALTYRGYAYMKLGEKDSAIKDFKAALEAEPTHLGANKYMADIYPGFAPAPDAASG